MTSMLPPTRDLPPGRQVRIRAELEQAVAGRRSRRLVPILAGVASVAAVATSVVLFRPTPAPTPAVQITTSPPPTTQTSVDFGVSPETVAAIEEGCAKSAGVGTAKLHQLLREETRWALLYTERESLTCNIGVGGLEYNSGFGQAAVKWLPGHFSLDSSSASSGGDLSGKPGYQGVPGYRTAAGRVDARVARVTITSGDRTVDAKIANGTYAARIYYPSTWGIPGGGGDVVVRAFDAQGTLLGTSKELWDLCYYDPQSQEVVYGDRRKPHTECLQATPWK